jgi:ornithine--oxo-acid transaminase
MPFDINALIEAHAGEAHSLYEAHVNPRFARALRIIGFDRTYVRGKGAYLWDDKGGSTSTCCPATGCSASGATIRW